MKTEKKKTSSLSLASVVTVLVIAMLACNLSTPKPANDFVCYKGITPGQTNKADVVALLGDPTRTEWDGADEILLYPSPFAKQSNTIIVQNQIVVLVDVLIGDDDALTFSAIKALYGEPSHIAYTNYLQGSMTYVYPDKGQAFIADENGDIVYTKQCFLPMSLEDYLNTWGKDLPTENPFTM